MLDSENIYGYENFDDNINLELEEQENYDDIDYQNIPKCACDVGNYVKYSTARNHIFLTKVKAEFSTEIELN